MSASGTSNHLERYLLNGPNVQGELRNFAEWLNKKDRLFEDINPGCSKCSDKEKTKAIRPLLKELGFDEKDPKLRFNVFRITDSSYINPGAGPGGYLIPIQQDRDTINTPTISNPSEIPEEEPQIELVVGERVYFDRIIFVRSSLDCVVVTID